MGQVLSACTDRDVAVSRARHLKSQLESTRTNMEKWATEARKGRRAEVKRRRAVILARYRGGQMVALAGVVKASAAELAQVKRTMADPTNPERASDIARLVAERDQARNACTALEQRCARMQDAVDGCAGTIEALASRVAVAEAKVRAAA